ncbi:hypothetical protein RRG08_003935 [Elysia crispata]|uniref:Uncharacterized protein n=1 Tax=Elysia crispata TaxID=231223 RepID=A0AAE0YBA9_9GAST|nr:hypothetical protein RRG08_003935 [Elysia crispata]
MNGSAFPTSIYIFCLSRTHLQTGTTSTYNLKFAVNPKRSIARRTSASQASSSSYSTAAQHVAVVIFTNLEFSPPPASTENRISLHRSRVVLCRRSSDTVRGPSTGRCCEI